MTIKIDPEENEIGALFDFVALEGARVLEIGSGDCRLTWRYATRAEQVTAVEPFAPAITRAKQHLPRQLEGRVVLRQATFGEFAAQAPASAFDVAIFSWSLCCMQRDRMVPALEEAHRLLGPSGTDRHPPCLWYCRRWRSTTPVRSSSPSPPPRPPTRACSTQTRRLIR